MSKNGNISLNKTLKKIIYSSAAGVITYMLIILFLSLLAYREAVSFEMSEKYFSKLALFPAACVCCIPLSKQGRGYAKTNFISVSIMLVVILFESVCIDENSDLLTMTITSILCYAGAFLMSIVMIKNSKMHKRRNIRK